MRLPKPTFYGLVERVYAEQVGPSWLANETGYGVWHISRVAKLLGMSLPRGSRPKKPSAELRKMVAMAIVKELPSGYACPSCGGELAPKKREAA